MTPTFKIDTTKFDAALGRYLEVSKKDLAEIFNQKAYYIARGSIRGTPRANYAKFAAELGVKLSRETRPRRAGGLTMGRKAKFVNNRVHEGEEMSLAERIILVRSRRAGREIPDKETRQRMAQRMVGARARSVGFLAAGWLQSIKTLAEKTGAKFRSSVGLKAFNANRIGKIGFCLPASGLSWKPRAFISNRANAKNDHKEALIKYGQPALQAAVDKEAASMVQYVENKMRARLKRMGVATH